MRHRGALALAVGVVAALPGAAQAAPGTLVRQGKGLYGQHCVACHGANGSGSRLAPSLRGVGRLAADFYLRTGYMPLRSAGIQPRRSRVLFSERQLRALIAYVGSLGKGPPIPHPDPAKGNVSDGLHLFTEHCAGCHQVVAEGGYVTNAVAPPLHQATPVQIAEAVRIGPYLMPSFPVSQISHAQLNSIIAYVQWAKHPDDRGGWSIGRIGPVPEGLVAWLIAATALVACCLVIGRRFQR